MVLAIETSDIMCGVAFWHEDRTLLEYSMELPMQHAALVGRYVEEGLKFLAEDDRQPSFTIDDIVIVSVAIGPGSFTGLRIGLAYAQGFCFGRDIPIVGISNHQVLADQRPIGQTKVITIIDARRNEVYLAEHRIAEGNFPEIHDHKIVHMAQLAQYLDPETTLIIKSGIPFDNDLINQLSRQCAVLQLVPYSAGRLARLGYEKFKRQGADDLDSLEPMYIRPFAGAH
ncbi:MAG: tRNA (adenosine(37)-N6)-threonylcarbamoyltransferase complex dimerization subunit type 1 TsaB [Calditrichaceae bacterium]|nr:tRNA (adenosine(37)-N6)-threonylcarbamoyltransferase complex dimerization subunit type 1 TsaB [Calditrichaceae bacterium]MBN2709523.1 tRNA (adenosine(37)-N6)-threonylcarbamoyltransferase complex dimerization subunit type 1 TsaB [Calditrichaceae bacterium]RQV93131.1 MAG: tRNA (adenosine(37)-N6)-threonylcarbamoyltransferase complex dimerization subunit type 1 TsaB [Calditrichota bacterium]